MFGLGAIPIFNYFIMHICLPGVSLVPPGTLWLSPKTYVRPLEASRITIRICYGLAVMSALHALQ